MTVFSYRAELPCDADRFLAALRRAEIVAVETARVGDHYDTHGEFQCLYDNLTVEQLRAAAQHVRDIRVLLDSLAPVPLAQRCEFCDW